MTGWYLSDRNPIGKENSEYCTVHTNECTFHVLYTDFCTYQTKQQRLEEFPHYSHSISNRSLHIRKHKNYLINIS